MQDNSFYSKYKYIRTLGHGGCSDVFLAENIALGKLWAVKEIGKDKKTTISGYIEPEILKRLNHPALPRICDVYEDEAKIYIVEDYIEGTCLKQELDIKGKFEEQAVIDWGIQLCSVLDYLHSQEPNPIIYGDMKPHNIILTKDGFVKLIDFGVSALISEPTAKAKKEKDRNVQENVSDNVANDTAFIGTKGYAAPEQFIGNGISRASDIYSLGITLIQLITGIDPLKAIATYHKDKYAQYLSPGLFEILRKCIHQNPELRYKSAGLLMKELRQLSLQSSFGNECNNKKLEKALHFTKIIAITGSRGTGISTIAAAMAEHMARGPTTACIVDMSKSGRLEKSLFGKSENTLSEKFQSSLPTVKDKSDFSSLTKINSNLYYVNLNNLTKQFTSDTIMLHKQLGQLQESFPYIFIDVDITLVKIIEKYINHIFIVSDMNPFNLLDISRYLQEESMVSKCTSRTSFIINKRYKGTLSSQSILQSMLIDENVPQELQELIAFSKTFELPYDEKIYFKWMYSFFDEPLRFKNLFNSYFGKAISNIITNTIYPTKRKVSRFSFDRR